MQDKADASTRVAVARLIPVVFLLIVPPVTAGITLNEVLYDPTGADGGKEFVELYNEASVTVGLDGWRLQFANGAVGDVWEGRWMGSAEDSISAYGFFVIVDQGWQGLAPDAIASLSLQNGPDAIRLLEDGAVADLLGYGDLELPELYEGRPHPGSGSGVALARRPDGRDTDDNATDWTRLADGTPGAPNFPAFGLEILAYRAEPPSLPCSGAEVHLELGFVNAGVDTLPAAVLTLRGNDRILAETVHEALIPEAVGHANFIWHHESDGLLELFLNWPLDSVDEASVTIPAGGFMSGLPPLILTEVMAGPESGACEWVEISALGDHPVALSDYALCDEGGTPSPLPIHDLQPGDRMILVQDTDKFTAWWRQHQHDNTPWPCPLVHPDFNTVELAGSWPTLNNTPPSDRDFADRVHLLDTRGVVVDHVTLGWAGAEVRTGRSLERSGPTPAGHTMTLWGPCTAAVGSTPGCANSLEAVVEDEGALIVTRSDSAGGEAPDCIIFSFTLYGSEISWRLEIYDLTGFRLRDLGGESLGPGPRRVFWDGRDDRGRQPPPEALVALLTIQGESGVRLRQHKALVVTATAVRP